MNPITFRHQFDRLYKPLGMFALRYVESVDEAEDIVQEAFIKAWWAISDGAQIDNFKAFMYRTVRNGCIDSLRSHRNMVGIDLAADVPDELIDTSERDARIWAAIDALPPKCREVFLLSKRDGLSQNEISEKLGISIKTIKNQLTKAFGRLREELGEDFLTIVVGLFATYSVIG